MAHYQGSKTGIRLLTALYRAFGYKAIKWLVFLVALFYALVSRSKRSELKSYYSALGLKPGFGTYLHHIYAFSLTIFDRILGEEPKFLARAERRQINKENFKYIGEHGGFALISHFGNNMQGFKVFDTFDIKVNLVVHEQASEKITSQEQGEAKNSRLNLINLAEGMNAMMQIAAAIREKEMVIMAVDRITDPKHAVTVDFLGKETLFNAAPINIAKKLKAPFIGVNAIRTDDQELLIHISDIFQTKRSDDSAQLMQSYVSFLEEDVREYPLQWFNFYDFWKEPIREA